MSKDITIDGVEGLWTPVRDVDVLPSGYVSPHFRLSEFTCNHCNQITHEPPEKLLAILEDLRAHFGGKPVTVTSAYRCSTHNANVGSTESSRHRVWDAVDLQVASVAAVDVYRYLDGQFPYQYGLGRYDTFTHFDLREHKARW